MNNERSTEGDEQKWAELSALIKTNGLSVDDVIEEIKHLTKHQQKWDELSALMQRVGLKVDDVITDIKVRYTNDGTKEFWAANHDLLDVVEEWNFDYSDMGYSDEISY